MLVPWSSAFISFTIALNMPFKQDPLDGKHQVRCAIGGGLRPDIWVEFKERFKIPQIFELFGATEGSLMTVNVSNRIGACGRASPLMVSLVDA